MKKEIFQSLRVCLTFAGAVLAGSLPTTVAAAPAAGYRILNKISASGHGGWDYLTVDEQARRLYVSHETEVEVLDVDSEKVVGSIPNLHGVHGIAIAPEVGRGFI